MHPNILDIHDEAGAEYDAAFEWYLARSPDSARKFDVEMNRALEQILLAPRRWAVGSHDTRTFLLSRFPFVVVYRELESGPIQVIAFAHCSRRPGYWKDRI